MKDVESVSTKALRTMLPVLRKRAALEGADSDWGRKLDVVRSELNNRR